MKAIIILAVMLIGFSAQAQTKKLQEQFGNYRLHQVAEFRMDTTYTETGDIDKITPTADMIILREGIDGNYSIAVTKTVYGKVNETIEYLVTKPEYINFKVVE